MDNIKSEIISKRDWNLQLYNFVLSTLCTLLKKSITYGVSRINM